MSNKGTLWSRLLVYVTFFIISWHSFDSQRKTYSFLVIFAGGPTQVWSTVKVDGQSRLLLQLIFPAWLRQNTLTPLAALDCDPGQESSPAGTSGIVLFIIMRLCPIFASPDPFISAGSLVSIKKCLLGFAMPISMIEQMRRRRQKVFIIKIFVFFFKVDLFLFPTLLMSSSQVPC